MSNPQPRETAERIARTHIEALADLDALDISEYLGEEDLFESLALAEDDRYTDEVARHLRLLSKQLLGFFNHQEIRS